MDRTNPFPASAATSLHDGFREVPRGGEPARRGRPVLATLSLTLLVLSLWIQAGRYVACRADGRPVLSCLLAP